MTIYTVLHTGIGLVFGIGQCACSGIGIDIEKEEKVLKHLCGVYCIWYNGKQKRTRLVKTLSVQLKEFPRFFKKCPTESFISFVYLFKSLLNTQTKKCMGLLSLL